MTIKIEITDPQLLPQTTLIQISKFLMGLAGAEIREAPMVVNPVLAELTPVEDLVTQEYADTVSEEDTHDALGIRWNSKVHTRTRSKNEDGSWKVQRGLTQDFIERTLGTAPVPTLQGTPVASLPDPTSIPWSNQGGIPITTPMPDPMEPGIDYPLLMLKVTDAVRSGSITHPEIAEILMSLGAPPLALLGTRPDLVPEVYKALQL